MLDASDTWYLESTKADFDMLKKIRHQIQEIPVDIKWEWVKGHQDNQVAFEELDTISQDNVLADAIAKAYMNQRIRRGEQSIDENIMAEGFKLKVKGKLCQQNLKTVAPVFVGKYRSFCLSHMPGKRQGFFVSL